MHAVVVNVTISDQEADEAVLREQVVPRVSAAPGFVERLLDQEGHPPPVDVDLAVRGRRKAASEMVGSAAPEGVTIDSVEVRELVASA